uniref:Uncharacterized protein n=1 Tax=Solanum lycopersicum TaxID=4081 RepID=K4CZ27_SOLLC
MELKTFQSTRTAPTGPSPIHHGGTSNSGSYNFCTI